MKTPNTITLRVGGKEHQVDLAPITLIFHQGGIDVPAADDIATISPEETLVFTSELTQKTWDTLRANVVFRECIKVIWGENAEYILILDAVNAEELASGKCSVDCRHTIGLIGLMLACIAMRRMFILRFPESYLHPKQQGNLANAFIILANLDGKLAERSNNFIMYPTKGE
jgi:hypothetical protein